MWSYFFWLKIFIVCSYITINLAVPNDHYCLAEDSQPYLYFSTKTAYEITQQTYEAEQDVLPRGIQVIPDCTPVGIWMFLRHGTRYPHAQEILRFKKFTDIRDEVIINHLERKNGELCGEDLDALKGWTFNITEDEADQLTWQGQVDLTQIAKRLKNHFKELLDATYTESRFYIRYSDSERTKESAKFFTKELFGRPIEITDALIDHTLGEEINCTSWSESASTEKATRELRLFKQGKYMKTTIHEVSERLGFKYDLSFDDVYDIYNLCRYDKAWYYKSVSPWCAAFTPLHLKVLEYYGDLQMYYSSGYGNPVSTKFGCPIVQDLIYRLNNLTKNSTSDVPPIALYFSHSVRLSTLLTRLGMAKDSVPPKHDNFNPATSTKRQWRTSIITPFAGNLAVVLYQCQGSNYKLMFYLNEQFIDYKGCHVGLCDWPYIYKSFIDIVNPSECNYNFCQEFSSALINTGTIWSLILTTIVIKMSS